MRDPADILAAMAALANIIFTIPFDIATERPVTACETQYG